MLPPSCSLFFFFLLHPQSWLITRSGCSHYCSLGSRQPSQSAERNRKRGNRARPSSLQFHRDSWNWAELSCNWWVLVQELWTVWIGLANRAPQRFLSSVYSPWSHCHKAESPSAWCLLENDIEKRRKEEGATSNEDERVTWEIPMRFFLFLVIVHTFPLTLFPIRMRKLKGSSASRSSKLTVPASAARSSKCSYRSLSALWVLFFFVFFYRRAKKQELDQTGKSRT